ncbi:MAG: sigma-70 family RNA polymerase sigma factor [Candidatus Marinimicrobia bacterium]|nr:sigma-70 family RNA polymerase sigma factor [Candidatus Neomarinimicrobiota bacterium]
MDSNQIEKLYREEKSKMISYVRSHMQDRTRDAEDLVQDVMLKMFYVVNLDKKIENLAAYAWRSLKNLVIDNLRRSISRNAGNDDPDYESLPSADTSPEDHMLREHFSEYLDRAINQLKPSERAIWIATEIECKSFQMLSEIWEEPLGTLLSRKYRAEKKILNTLNNLYKEN